MCASGFKFKKYPELLRIGYILTFAITSIQFEKHVSFVRHCALLQKLSSRGLETHIYEPRREKPGFLRS